MSKIRQAPTGQATCKPLAILGLQELSRVQFSAETGRELAVAVDDLTIDDRRADQVVVTVDHPFDTRRPRVGRLGVGSTRAVEPGRVDDGDVGSLAVA